MAIWSMMLSRPLSKGLIMFRRLFVALALVPAISVTAAADPWLDGIVMAGLERTLPGLSVRTGLITLDEKARRLVITDMRLGLANRGGSPLVSIARVESPNMDRAALEKGGYDPFAQPLDLKDLELADGRTKIRAVSLEAIPRQGGNSQTLFSDLQDGDPVAWWQRLLQEWRVQSFTVSGLSTERGARLESLTLLGLEDGQVKSLELAGLANDPPDCQPSCLEVDGIKLKNTNLPALIGRIAAMDRGTDQASRDEHRRNVAHVILGEAQVAEFQLNHLSLRRRNMELELGRLAVDNVQRGALARLALEDLRALPPGGPKHQLRLKSFTLERSNLLRILVEMDSFDRLPQDQRQQERLRLLTQTMVMGGLAVEGVRLSNINMRLEMGDLRLDEWRDGGMHGLEVENLLVADRGTLPTRIKLDRLSLGANTLPGFFAAMAGLNRDRTDTSSKASAGMVLNLLANRLTIASLELDDLNVQKLPVAVGLDTISLSGLKHGLPKTFHMEDLKVAAGPAGRFGLDAIRIATTRDGKNRPIRMELLVDDMELTSQIGPLANGMKEVLGSLQAHLQAQGVMEWDWDKRRIQISKMTAQLADQADLDLTVTLGMPPAELPLDSLPIETMTLFEQTLAIKDHGLVGRLIDMRAKAAGGERAGFLEGMRAPLRKFLSGIVSADGVDDATRSVMSFLERGGTLDVRIQPLGDTPPTLPEIDAQRRKRSLHKVLDVAITRSGQP